MKIIDIANAIAPGAEQKIIGFDQVKNYMNK